jgi:DNA-3-methyladenine glycosylase II
MSDLDTAYRSLAKADPVLARLVEAVGRPDPFTWSESHQLTKGNFQAMALHIVGQQISTAAALTIYGRVVAAVGGELTAASAQSVSVDVLRAAGLSRAKASYLHALAARELDGLLDLDGLSTVDDAEALAALTAVKGVGLWSAQMFLVHQLKRTDVLPAGDVGIRRAVERAWGLASLPTVEEARTRALPWSPYRTYAAALLWRSLAGPGQGPARRTG